MHAARAELESLLRARRLDVTLTSAGAGTAPDQERLAPTGWAALDAGLAGGLRRGHLSEIIGPRSSGRTALACAAAAAATARGEAVAFVDTFDRFDPAGAASAGVDASRLLWIREAGNADRALKAMNLVLQAGGFGLVVFDLCDASHPVLRRFPHTTWMRLARVIEGSATVALLIGSEHIARSPGGVTIALDAASTAANGEWHGASARSLRLGGLPLRPRVISARTVLTPAAAAPCGSAAPVPAEKSA